MTNCIASPQAMIVEPEGFPELMSFMDFSKFMNFVISANSQIKRPNSRKSLNSQKREDWTPVKEEVPASQPTPNHKLSMMSMVWNISTGQLGLAAWLCSLPAPAPLLIIWMWETGKSPWFLSNNQDHQCIINILIILNPKHSSHWEEN